jgi:serine/threonine protein kinase
MQIGEDGHVPSVEIAGRLPPDPDLCQHYIAWAAAYRQLGLRPRLEAITIQATNVSVLEDCYRAARQLGDRLNTWLYSESFRPIREKLLEQLMPSDQVRLIIQTENIWLRRLPWHLWDFYDRYPKTEIALSAPAYERVEQPSIPKRSGVRTLAILGNSAGIDTQTDRRLLSQLPNSKITFLVEPQRQELTDELWRQGWNILFFAGHSSSQADGETGRIYLNQTDSLTIDQLRYALKNAVGRGLKIAMFNSCDGLGLARSLQDLKIPQIIVMREPVPDKVAQEFLKSFLAAFAQGKSFYLSVREARERLQGMEDEFPCATWLPIICQNPAVVPPTWEGMGGDLLTHVSQDLESVTVPDTTGFSTRTAETPTPLTGLINQRYQVQEVLGQGGFGRTYLAADTHRFGDLCVLKQFAPASTSASAIRRSRELFEREAKVLYQIDHPQIPKFLAWFTQDGQLYIVQEYINGKTYLRLLEERQREGRSFSEIEVVRWLIDLLPVLDYLHSIDIIHRDISPGNVMLPHNQTCPVLIDFGVVKEVASQIWSGQFSNFRLAQQVSRVGKPGYAPPEQMQLGQCFPCSDLYALGVTAIVLLTGRQPQWLLEPQRPGKRWRSYVKVSDQFLRILEKLLADNPRDRYQSAKAALVDLQPLALANSNSTRLPVADDDLTQAPPTAWQAANVPQGHPNLPPPKQSSLEKTPIPAPVTRQVISKLGESTTQFTFTPEFLERCRQELARCIGPMASCILEDALAQHQQTTPQQFVNALIAEIPDAHQANEFKEKMKVLVRQLPRAIPSGLGHSQPGGESFSGRAEASSHSNSARIPPTVDALTPEFLERCRRELARYIGPMATYILEDILMQFPQMTRQQFVRAIAAEIPDPKQAKEFQQHLLQ